MARVTVEDCVDKIPNRFDLVMTAAQRARNISAGAPLTVEADNDKNHVVALREIAELTVDLDALQEQLIQSMQRHVEIDEPDEDELDMISIQQEVLGETEDAAPAPSVASEASVAEEAETPKEPDVFAQQAENIFAKMEIDPNEDESGPPEQVAEVEAAAVFEDATVEEIAQDLSEVPEQTNEQTKAAPESSVDAEAPGEDLTSEEVKPESGDPETK